MTMSAPPRLLNLGCGHRLHPAWVNADLVAQCPGVMVIDVSRGLPFPDAHFDTVYHAAMLEHLRREEVPAFLRECHRVLKPGGVLRIAVPDLETICRLYLQKLEAAAAGQPGAEADHEWMTIELLDQAVRERSGGGMVDFLRRNPLPNEPFVLERTGEEGRELLALLRTPTGAPPPAAPSWWRHVRQRIRRGILARLLGAQGERALAIGRFRLSGEVHHWMYDRVSLARLLRAAGLIEPRQHSAAESRIANWKGYHLDTLPRGAATKPDLFYMEAVKP